MKISGRKPVVRTTGPGGPLQPSESVERPEIESASAVESGATDVALSDTLRDVNRAKEMLSEMSDVRVDRIKEIKPRVDDGSYKIENELVAKRMVDSAIRESARKGRSGGS